MDKDLSIDKWYHHKPAYAILLFIMGSSILIPLIAEISLRVSGYQPGLLAKYSDFSKVDGLALLKGYEADSSGIIKISKESREYTMVRLSTDGNRLMMKKKEFAGEIVALADDFKDFNQNKTNNDFQHYIQSLKQKMPQTLTEVEQAYLAYCFAPINKEGFRSIAFNQYESNKKTILLIGDSFTWGSEPENITNSFADVISSRGYIVFNTGITATDPAQYLAVAKKYIPLLQRDIVVVNFFLGNDIVHYKRETKPGQLAYYPTNAGNLLSFPDGFYLDTPEMAYDYILRQLSIPNQDRNVMNNLLAKTVLGTRLWILLRKLNIIPFQVDYKYLQEREEALQLASTYPVSEYYLKQIKILSESFDALFILSAIPEVKELHLTIPDGYPGLFRELKIHAPNHITEADYAPDEHFNKSGNLKYANFILSLIESKNSSVTP